MITNTLELIRQEIRDAANSTTFAASLEKIKKISGDKSYTVGSFS